MYEHSDTLSSIKEIILNYSLFKSINQHAGHHPFWDAFMAGITNNALFIFAIVLVLMWLFGKNDMKRTVLYAGITGIVALILNSVIAHIYFEPRPFVSHEVNLLVPHDADASFPSDHTTGSIALALAVLYVHRKLGSVMLAFALLTGFSRIYVGNHYPFDVAGSIVVAGIVSLVVYKLYPILDPLINGIIRIYNRIPFVPKSKEAERSIDFK